MIRTFSLINEPGGLGLSCTSAGLALAGVPLLRKTEIGFVPRPAPEIASLIESAYGVDPTRLRSSLSVIAQALNCGDVARATITAILTRTPELSREASAQLANVEEGLTKYNADEPRDWHGRWTREEAAAPASTATSAGGEAANQEADTAGLQILYLNQDAADWQSLITPAASTMSDDATDGGASRNPASLEQAFERKYDDLGPIDFAKQVIQFGDWLGREGKNLSQAESEQARSEYSFLQDRLSFWLTYDYKPAIAHANLLSAALILYQGAINGGIAQAGELPRSMVDVGGGVWAFDNIPPHIRPAPEPAVEKPPPRSVFVPKEIAGLGTVVENNKVGIKWNEGIKDQGRPFEIYYGKQNPDTTELRPNSKTFDFLNEMTGEAVSLKALNTLSVTYIKSPQKVYSRLKSYIDEAADYEPRRDSDVEPAKIESKTLQLAIPEYTSSTQWRYLFQAIIYGKERNVRIVITWIRE